jgi:glycerophosphoryl diester phosphodiesterase
MEAYTMINRLNRVCGALLAAASVALLPLPAQASDNERDDRRGKPAHYDDDGRKGQDESIQVGQRPLYLVDGMDDGPLKRRLLQCKDGPFRKTDFSIGHRGAALQFPEHTQESYVAAARQGAGIVECDVTFTKDGKLVCRHAENDLHTTTNILSTPLAGTCIKPFTPAMIDASGKVVMAASAECRTSTLSLDEFKSLRGKMDASNPAARSVAEYQGGTASWRTDLYTGRGTLLSFRESIELNQALDVKHTPELKGGDADTIKQVFGSQENYALAFAAELRAARVKPRDVWPQSFNVEDVLTWIGKTEYGRQAVYLLDYNATDPVNDIVIQPPYDQMDRSAYFRMLKQRGVKIIAPPIPALLAVNANGRVVPSQLAKDLKSMGFDIITWTIERSDLRKGAAATAGNPTYYFDFDPSNAAIRKDSDLYTALDVLARDVKILGIFSDWPATVTYYANCMGLK